MKRWDEITVLEELDIRSADLIEKFEDIIEEQADRLEQLVNWEE
jgi:hypothetical protein